ncbi:MAG TPA: metalloprotease TldD, partial [Gammaproteobacteria bacterium]|nr:metalloprotease TldD [Gammaproteobacteria bacterium]
MSQALDTARQTLLAPAGLGDRDLEALFGQLLAHRLDYADLYFQYSRHESWSLEEGQVKSGSYSVDQGVGVRAVSGEKTGFAYSDVILLPALTDAAMAARAIARHGASATAAVRWRPGPVLALYAPLDPLASLEDAAKVRLLEQVEAEARAADPRVTQVMASLSGVQDVMLVARSDGILAADVRPLVRLNVTVIVEANGRRETASHGGGGRVSYQQFLQNHSAREYAQTAVRQALVNLEADEAPAGTMKVVLGPGWPGILLHEAIGHGLEGDFNRKGSS